MAKFQILGTDKDGKRRRWLIEANNVSGAMKKAENLGLPSIRSTAFGMDKCYPLHVLPRPAKQG
ncbi:MAG: hypothetical protein R3C28_02665 [Pirellulaceae bacterium]